MRCRLTYQLLLELLSVNDDLKPLRSQERGRHILAYQQRNWTLAFEQLQQQKPTHLVVSDSNFPFGSLLSDIRGRAVARPHTLSLTRAQTDTLRLRHKFGETQ